MPALHAVSLLPLPDPLLEAPKSLSELLSEVLQAACSVFDAYSGVIFTRDARSETYVLSASFSLGDGLDARARISATSGGMSSDQTGSEDAPSPGGVLGWILRERRPLAIGAFDSKRSRLGYYKDAESEGRVRAFMGRPLDGGLGAIALDTRRSYAFTPKDEKILAQFARLAADLVAANARLARRQRESDLYRCMQAVDELLRRKLRWSDLLDELLGGVSAASGFPTAFLATCDRRQRFYSLEGWNRPFFEDPADSLAVFPLGAGLIGWVFKNRTPVWRGKDEPAPGGASLFGRDLTFRRPRTVACLPLPVLRATRGVLVLTNESEERIDDGLKDFLTGVAERLAMYLENLYLKNKLAARLEARLGEKRAMLSNP